MRVIFRKSFERDLKKLKGNAELLTRLQQVVERLETTQEFAEVGNVKRMHGWSSYYRVRIGDYRLGLKLEEDAVVVLRFLHRREIYRRVP